MAAISTGTGTPTRIRAGDTVSFTNTFGDHPASTWSQSIYFIRPGEETIQVDSTASSDDFLTTLTPANTARFSPGRWEVVHRVVGATGTTVADTSVMDVLPNPEIQAGEAFAEKALALVEKSLLNDMPTAQESVSIAGVDITKMSISERLAMRDRLKAEVVRLRKLAKLKAGIDGPARHGLQIRFAKA